MAMTAWSAKVLSKSDLLVREGTDLGTTNRNSSNRDAFSQQWRGKDSSSAVVAE